MPPSFCRIVLLRLFLKTWHSTRYLSHCRAMWKVLLNVNFPAERGTGHWIPDNEYQSTGWGGAIDSKRYAFPSCKHMTERPIYELSMRHRPNNQPPFHRRRNGYRRLAAFPAPRLHDRASFREREKPRELEVDSRCAALVSAQLHTVGHLLRLVAP